MNRNEYNCGCGALGGSTTTSRLCLQVQLLRVAWRRKQLKLVSLPFLRPLAKQQGKDGDGELVMRELQYKIASQLRLQSALTISICTVGRCCCGALLAKPKGECSSSRWYFNCGRLLFAATACRRRKKDEQSGGGYWFLAASRGTIAAMAIFMAQSSINSRIKDTILLHGNDDRGDTLSSGDLRGMGKSTK